MINEQNMNGGRLYKTRGMSYNTQKAENCKKGELARKQAESKL